MTEYELKPNNIDDKNGRKKLAAALAVTAVITVLLICFVIWSLAKRTGSPQQGATLHNGTEITQPPAPQQDIKTILDGNQNLKIFDELVNAAELKTTLDTAGPFTIFAPDDFAFKDLPVGTVDMLLQPNSKTALTKLVSSLIVPGTLLLKDLRDGQSMTSLSGSELTIRIHDGKTFVSDSTDKSAMVLIKDNIASNGVIHTIDLVLRPV